eukprot:8742523-Pyramimonas_sp.AAC.1
MQFSPQLDIDAIVAPSFSSVLPLHQSPEGEYLKNRTLLASKSVNIQAGSTLAVKTSKYTLNDASIPTGIRDTHPVGSPAQAAQTFCSARLSHHVVRKTGGPHILIQHAQI